MTEKAKEFRALKDKKEKLEADLKGVNKQIVQVETIDLPKLMEDNDIEKFSIEGVGTVYVETETYVNVLKDDRDALYSWLREQGHGTLVKDWVFPQTLAAFVKEQKNLAVEEGGHELPEFVKVTEVPTARIRRK
jgi:hypothetical protein